MNQRPTTPGDDPLDVVHAPVDIAATSDQLTRMTSGELTDALADDSLPTAGLESAIEWSRRISLLLIDVDRFADLAAGLGPEGSEAVLDGVAARLRKVLRPNQILARLDEDDFAVVLPAAGGDVAERVAQDLAGQLEEAVVISFDNRTTPVPVTVSIGVASCLVPWRDPRNLVEQASLALAVAKRSGGGISTFDSASDAPVRSRPRNELRVALEKAEVEVFLQPQHDLRTGAVVGTEALARWRHPRDGVLLPAAFLPLASRTGLLRPITAAVLDLALAACAQWWHAGRQVPVSVNLAPTDLLDPELTDRLPSLLAPLNLPPSALRVEVTEEVFMADTAPVARVLHRWRSEGVTVALDDFGTGYSSLAYLRALPISELKLDKVFVADLSRSTTATIVRHTIAMAHELGMTVVAEGIETPDKATILREMGCDVGQGLLFGDAMPLPDFLAYLESSSADG